jgi:hypothetical protein
VRPKFLAEVVDFVNHQHKPSFPVTEYPLDDGLDLQLNVLCLELNRRREDCRSLLERLLFCLQRVPEQSAQKRGQVAKLHCIVFQQEQVLLSGEVVVQDLV